MSRRPPRTPRTPRTTRNAAVSTPSSGRGSRGFFDEARRQWMCDCTPRQPAVLRETRKPGANQGRWFYTCPQERRRQCTFFMWEDYADAASGSAGGSHGPSGASSAPRPTYRTSIGPRTTPPAERQDAPVPASAPGPTRTARATRTAMSAQRPLPPPQAPTPTPSRTQTQPRPQDGWLRQRIFTTPTAASPNSIRHRYDNGGYGDGSDGGDGDGAYADDQEDGADQAPPTPTPTPMRTRRPSSNGAPSVVTRPAAAAEPAPARPPEPASHPITRYFGVVKTEDASSPAADKNNKNDQNDKKNKNKAATPPCSDSEFDSDMERALVALADHTERATMRRDDSGGSGNSGVLMDLDGHEQLTEPERAMPVRARPAYPSATVTPRRGSRRLLVASEAYASQQDAAGPTDAADAADAAEAPSVDTETAMATPPAPVTSDALPSSLPSSLPSTASTANEVFSQTPTQTSINTTPISSFWSDIDAGSSGHKRRRHDAHAWFAASSAKGSNGGGGDDSNDDPFTSTPSKRVRFLDALHERGRTQQGRGTEDAGASHTDRDATPMPATPPSSQDHNVTLAVLQLLVGQPVEARVRQQIRALLNSAFAAT